MMKTAMNLYGQTIEVSNGKRVLSYALHPECVTELRSTLPETISIREIGPTETDGDTLCALQTCGRALAL